MKSASFFGNRIDSVSISNYPLASAQLPQDRVSCTENKHTEYQAVKLCGVQQVSTMEGESLVK